MITANQSFLLLGSTDQPASDASWWIFLNVLSLSTNRVCLLILGICCIRFTLMDCCELVVMTGFCGEICTSGRPIIFDGWISWPSVWYDCYSVQVYVGNCCWQYWHDLQGVGGGGWRRQHFLFIHTNDKDLNTSVDFLPLSKLTYQVIFITG